MINPTDVKNYPNNCKNLTKEQRKTCCPNTVCLCDEAEQDFNRELAEALDWKFNGNTISRGLFMPAHPTAFSILTRFDPLHDSSQFDVLKDIPIKRGYEVSICPVKTNGKITGQFRCLIWDVKGFEGYGKDKREAFLRAVIKLLESEDG